MLKVIIINNLIILLYSHSILLGLIDDKWNAKTKWTRANFKKYYGDKKVKTGLLLYTIIIYFLKFY